jgi:putative Mn2+ efflux pump MntP
VPVVELLLIAIGVSADAFAVALTQGVAMRRFDWRRALLIAALFGGFQAVMPLIGWLLGGTFIGYISDWDHWIAFALLALIGGKMLWEALRGGDDDADERTGLRALLVLSLATSIDALAVGVSLTVLPIDIWVAIALIGATTLLLSLLAAWLGHKVGGRLGRPAEIVGGLILIGIGVKIVLEHTGVLG